MSAALDDAHFLDTKQAALYMGISESWLRQRRMTGILEGQRPAPPYIKLGRAVRYNKSVLDEWLAQQCSKPGNSPGAFSQ